MALETKPKHPETLEVTARTGFVRPGGGKPAKPGDDVTLPYGLALRLVHIGRVVIEPADRDAVKKRAKSAAKADAKADSKA
jgi:hypothetical protein